VGERLSFCDQPTTISHVLKIEKTKPTSIESSDSSRIQPQMLGKETTYALSITAHKSSSDKLNSDIVKRHDQGLNGGFALDKNCVIQVRCPDCAQPLASTRPGAARYLDL
jgi:hypothetical protein